MQSRCAGVRCVEWAALNCNSASSQWSDRLGGGETSRDGSRCSYDSARLPFTSSWTTASWICEGQKAPADTVTSLEYNACPTISPTLQLYSARIPLMDHHLQQYTSAIAQRHANPEAVADSRELAVMSDRNHTHLTPAESDKGSIHECRVEAHPSNGVRVLRIVNRPGESFDMAGVERAEGCSKSVNRCFHLHLRISGQSRRANSPTRMTTPKMLRMVQQPAGDC
jgi:hypothetical protein